MNPEAAEKAGVSPLLLAWARRTKNGLESSDRQVEALATITSELPYYNHLGGDDMRVWVKAVQSEAPVFIDVLGLPYDGPHDGKDTDGNWFSPQTDFMDGVIDYPPVLYGHGSTTGVDSDVHGKVHARWYANDGGWFKVELKRDSPRFAQLYDAHKKGTLRASSGAVPATVQVAPSGHIDRWLVGELTLVDTRDGYRPANGYAITKAAFDETIFTSYYGDPVKEAGVSLWERIAQAITKLREDIASMVAGENIEVPMAKCEKCDGVAAEEAENLRQMLVTMKADQDAAEAAKPKECLPCRAAVKWVGAMVKASKLTINEALDAVNRFEVNADDWETFREEVESRNTTIRTSMSKASTLDPTTKFSLITGNSPSDAQNTIDPAYMDRMRTQVNLKVGS